MSDKKTVKLTLTPEYSVAGIDNTLDFITKFSTYLQSVEGLSSKLNELGCSNVFVYQTDDLIGHQTKFFNDVQNSLTLKDNPQGIKETLSDIDPPQVKSTFKLKDLDEEWLYFWYQKYKTTLEDVQSAVTKTTYFRTLTENIGFLTCFTSVPSVRNISDTSDYISYSKSLDNRISSNIKDITAQFTKAQNAFVENIIHLSNSSNPNTAHGDNLVGDLNFPALAEASVEEIQKKLKEEYDDYHRILDCFITIDRSGLTVSEELKYDTIIDGIKISLNRLNNRSTTVTHSRSLSV